MPITIGAGAIDGDSISSSTITFVDLTGPASGSGTITSVQVWSSSNLTGFVIGTFFLVSGTTYECRASTSIGGVEAGAVRTFVVSLAAEAGDFLGCYYVSGTLERSTSGGNGYRFTTGNHVVAEEQTNFTNFTASNKLSLYGTGLGSPPTVTSATPSHEHKTITNDIILAGTKLTGATDVDFGADITINSYLVDSDIQITANITITTGAALGVRDVAVITPNGTGTLVGGFSVEAAPAPPAVSGSGAYFARQEQWRGSNF